MKTPLRTSVYTVCLNAVLNILAVFCLPVEWRHVGLAASTTLCAGCGCVLLAYAARRRNGSLGLDRLVAPVLKMLFGSALMAAALFAVKMGVKGLPICRLALAIAAGAAVYFGVMAAMGLRWRRRPVAR
jgi:peptidoglycan biosynthesis protein MviN/MurJ (putative lipid II flippase)